MANLTDERVTHTTGGRSLVGSALRFRQVTGAFMWLGITESVAYPLMLLLNNMISPSVLPLMYYFISRLVESGADVGHDYYTYVIIGLATNTLLNGGLTAFSRQVDAAVQQGRFETFLVQPISWYTLPFSLAVWPAVLAGMNATVMAVIGLGLGVRIELAMLPAAVLILALGLAAAHGIGTLSASARLLSKDDPVTGLYSLAATIFSGALFPVSMLPWFIRPVAYLLPHTYVISAARRVLMPHGEAIGGPSMAVSIGALVVSTIVLYTIGLFVFGRSLEFGRRYGILGGY